MTMFGLFKKKEDAPREVDVDRALTAVPEIWPDVEAKLDSKNLLQLRRVLPLRSRSERFFARTLKFKRAVRANLDERGTFFWKSIDGRRPLKALSKRLAKRFEGGGAAAVVYTDIQRDGMRTGPNIPATQRLAGAIDLPVIASGGVSDLEDVKGLLGLEPFGVMGMITGRALYDGSLDLGDAIRLCRGI